MASDSYDLGLVLSFDVQALKMLSYLPGCLDPVHDRHLYVSEYDRVLEADLVDLLDLVDGLLAGDAKVALVLHADARLE